MPNGTNLDAIFQQSIPRRLEVGHEKTTATERAGEPIAQPRAELDRATGARRCKLNKADRIVWCVVNVNPKSDTIDVEARARPTSLTGNEMTSMEMVMTVATNASIANLL